MGPYIAITRRAMLARLLRTGFAGAGGIILVFLGVGCGAGTGGGFGGIVEAGRLTDMLSEIEQTRQPFYVPSARSYINPFPRSALSAARSAPSYARLFEGLDAGVVALYQKCTHLGCRVPWCASSQWFECPCHGSKYNRVGEQRHGPAPRGLDRFVVKVQEGQVSIDTGTVIVGPPVGTDTTGQVPEGPYCAS
jgi:cytochrome b6-f complex iron-sulfur subunit